MKRLLFFLIILFTFTTCGTQKKWSDIGTDGSLVQVLDSTVKIDYLKELYQKDTVSSNLNNWLEMGFYDNKRQVKQQWLYIKDTDTNKIYVLTKETDSTYRINIRTIIIEKDVK